MRAQHSKISRNPTLEPYSVSGDRKEKRKRPFASRNEANITDFSPNLAKKAKKTYDVENATKKLESSVNTIKLMVLVLQNEGLDENNEHNIDMAKFDDIVYDLLEVKKYLENPMVKEVFVVPDEYLPTENAFDFNSKNPAQDNPALQNRKRINPTGMNLQPIFCLLLLN